MPLILIVDTSVFMNVLDVEGFNQSRGSVLDDLRRYIDDKSISMLLPYAVVLEAGNHIAQLSDGGNRRRFGEKFVEQVCLALDGIAPWTPTKATDLLKLRTWLGEFANCAMRGLGMADMLIVKEWEEACKLHPHHRVRIWSLDNHLSSHDRVL